MIDAGQSINQWSRTATPTGADHVAGSAARVELKLRSNLESWVSRRRTGQDMSTEHPAARARSFVGEARPVTELPRDRRDEVPKKRGWSHFSHVGVGSQI